MLPILKEYDAKSKTVAFDQTSYACSVCMSSVKGAKCVLLSCQHVFCRGCLEDFWRLCISEGDVARVGCPDPECVKSGREAVEEEIRRVVTEEELTRWKWLKEKRMLEKGGKCSLQDACSALMTSSDPSIIHCPVQICQTPVPAPKGQDTAQASGWDRLRTCPVCAFSFCAFCRRTWHGPISECPLSVTDSFVNEYMALPEGSAKRRLLEQRYGKANLVRLVARLEEERANRKWLEESATACPYCNVYVEKSMGCNHVRNSFLPLLMVIS
jgi:E3 ubiquitin-protein ligase RNF14